MRPPVTMPSPREHVNFIPECLPVVGGVIQIEIALVVQFRHFAVGFLREMAAEATRVP